VIPRRLRSDRRGLSLIELVLTLTILAFAGALVSGAFVTGLRAWQSGLRSGREELVARIVLERIATQLRSAISSPAKHDNGDAIAFDAAEDHLRFVTLAAGGTAPVQVFYGLRGGGAGDAQLVYREYPWPDKEFFGDGRQRSEENIPEITGFSVKAVKRIDTADTGEKDSAAATEDWSPLDEKLPASVSVEIVVSAENRQEPRRYRITVPILTQDAP
jgi:prepilin-type N-terminal cleavage/methylation domain-containing protein